MGPLSKWGRHAPLGWLHTRSALLLLSTLGIQKCCRLLHVQVFLAVV